MLACVVEVEKSVAGALVGGLALRCGDIHLAPVRGCVEDDEEGSPAPGARIQVGDDDEKDASTHAIGEHVKESAERRALVEITSSDSVHYGERRQRQEHEEKRQHENEFGD